MDDCNSTKEEFTIFGYNFKLFAKSGILTIQKLTRKKQYIF